MTRVLFLLCGGAIFLAAFVDFAGIVGRALSLPGVDFGAKLATWLVVWAGFLAAAPLARELDGHVAIKLVPALLSKKISRALQRLSVVFSLIASLLLAYAGILMTQSLFQRGARYALMVDTPQWIVKLAVAVGMTLLAAYCLVALLRGQSATPRDPAEGLASSEPKP
ncbi:MAG TPA: TRAP transporter small permease [Kiloniellales bacterium]|nr:TRAP transporter small permease [Kiloniellales bacterium]